MLYVYSLLILKSIPLLQEMSYFSNGFFLDMVQISIHIIVAPI